MRPRTAAILVLPLLLSGCDLFGDKLLSACEEELKSRLKAPSTYTLIRKDEFTAPVEISDYRKMLAEGQDKDSPNALLADVRTAESKRATGEPGPTRHTLFIEYDADNSFGVPLRGVTECEYISGNGDKGGAGKYSVKINGKDHSQWMDQRIKALNGG